MLPPIGTQTQFTYHDDVQNVASGMIPRIYNRSYAISAEVVIPEGGAEGVIVVEADHLGGFSLFIEDGKLKHTYSMMGALVYRQESDGSLPIGDVTLRMEFEADSAAPATGGDVRLFANGHEIGKGRMDQPCQCDSPLTRGWTLAETTVEWWTELCRQGSVRLHRTHQEGGFRPEAAHERRGRAGPPRACPTSSLRSRDQQLADALIDCYDHPTGFDGPANVSRPEGTDRYTPRAAPSSMTQTSGTSPASCHFT